MMAPVYPDGQNMDDAVGFIDLSAATGFRGHDFVLPKEAREWISAIPKTGLRR
jgi:hypothetical protein